MGFIKKLFKRKKGGTFLGNTLRYLIKNETPNHTPTVTELTIWNFIKFKIKKKLNGLFQ